VWVVLIVVFASSQASSTGSDWSVHAQGSLSTIIDIDFSNLDSQCACKVSLAEHELHLLIRTERMDQHSTDLWSP